MPTAARVYVVGKQKRWETSPFPLSLAPITSNLCSHPVTCHLNFVKLSANLTNIMASTASRIWPRLCLRSPFQTGIFPYSKHPSFQFHRSGTMTPRFDPSCRQYPYKPGYRKFSTEKPLRFPLLEKTIFQNIWVSTLLSNNSLDWEVD